MSQLLTVRQAAYILKVHPLTIRRYIKEKKLIAVKVAGNVRIREDDLNNMNKEVQTTPTRRPKVAPVTEVKIFTFEDPLFRLKGRAASLSLPEAE